VFPTRDARAFARPRHVRAYWIGQHSYAGDSSLRFLRHEARIAFINTADLGQRLEGEALLEARVTRQVDLAFDVREVEPSRRRGLERRREPRGTARRRVGSSLDSLSLISSFRYDGLSVPELDGPGRVLASGAVRHADFSAAWEPMDALRLSVLSGLSSDLQSHTSRRWIGPEIGLPRLLGDSTGFRRATPRRRLGAGIQRMAPVLTRSRGFSSSSRVFPGSGRPESRPETWTS